MTAYSQGDVVLVPFPFTDFSTLKQRPAAVISSSKFNASQKDLIVCAITSHVPPKLSAMDYALESSDLKLAGLPKSSIIKLGKIVTIDQRLIRRKLGRLSDASLSETIHRIHKIVSIP